jgi:Skp family chaperone for outer membrane proteins
VNRAFVYLSALVGVGGMLSLAGAAAAQPPAGAPGAPPAAPPTATASRPTVAVFNMAAVMRDFNKAKYQVYKLNEKRIKNSANLMKWRSEYLKLQQEVPKVVDPGQKDKMEKDALELARKIQDEERRINKDLNDDASKIISGLYDEIKTVVDKTADMNSYHIVFAYPDAVTAEEQANPYLKELKLKPPAAQPFYVNKQVDITGVVIQALNTWYPALNEQNQPVDVNKLPPLEAPNAPGSATTGAPGAPGGPPVLPAGAPPAGTPGRP